MTNNPLKITTENELEEWLSRPVKKTVQLFRKLKGDIIFLGVAGKIGPSLAHMTKRACEEIGRASCRERVCHRV